jgi:transposase
MSIFHMGRNTEPLWEIGMRKLTVAEDVSVKQLRALARAQKDGRTTIRFMTIAFIQEGHSVPEASKNTGASEEAIRHWVHRYNEKGVAGLYDRQIPGRPCRMNGEELKKFQSWLDRGPEWNKHHLTNWTQKALCEVVADEFGKEYSIRGMGLLIYRIGYRKLTVRPRHMKSAPELQEHFKKTSRR